MTAQEIRAVVMLIASLATTIGAPGVEVFIRTHPESVVGALTGAWGLIAALQAWRKRKDTRKGA